MNSHLTARWRISSLALSLLALGTCLSATAGAQIGRQSVQFKVRGPSQRMEMIVNTSRILTLDKKVPRVQVNNPDIVRPTPLSPNQIQVAAMKPGVTQVNLWDENDEIHSVNVIVYGDARELEMLLETEFKNASLKVRPLASSVVLSGYVDEPEAIPQIIRMAEDYYPKVINNIKVGGVQQVLLHVKVMEVSRTKLRAMGFDWAAINGSDFVVSSVSQIINATAAQAGVATAGGDTIRFGFVEGSTSFFGFLEALRQNNLMKLLAEPTLMTVSGRPASFNSGGLIAYDVSQGLGAVATEFREFGTRVDFVPIVLGNGNLRLEIRPEVSEIDQTLGSASGVPGFRNRWVDTAVEMKSGQTLALAGLIQTRTEAENRGVPWVADLPWIGAAFRRVEETANEVELVILVTPELVDPLDRHEVPPCGPGTRTTSPDDVELYWRGYIEVPRCCTDGGCSRCQGAQAAYEGFGGYQMGRSGGKAKFRSKGKSAAAMPPGQVQPSMETRSSVFSSTGTAPQRDRLDVQDRPVADTPLRIPSNRFIRNEPSRPAASPPTPAETNGSGLIGPIGYDVLNLNN